MPMNKCCCLCCNSCSEYKLLENHVGESNKIYEIVVKYFDPMLLTGENTVKSEQFQVLCAKCWFHVNNFHEFQQTVLNARMLFEDKRQLQVLAFEAKQENEDTNLKQCPHFERLFDFDNIEGYKNPAEDNEHSNALIVPSTTSYENTIELQTEQVSAHKLDNRNHQLKLSSKLSLRRKSKYGNKKTILFAESDLVKQDNSRKKLKLPDNTKGKGSSSTNIKKAKELDAFIANWKPDLICDICSESTNNFDKLRIHFREKHKTKFYIKCCERKFFRRYVFANHIQLHLDPETHKCEICGKSSSSKKNLRLHKKLVHELTKQLKCEICEKLFKQKVTLARHLLTHATGSKDFTCTDCGKGFVADQLLKIHIKHVHNTDRVCDKCGRTIHGLQAYKKHLMEHAGIEMVKFPCDVCGLQCSSSNGLKKHKAAYHNDGSTIYVCGVCGKVAANENALWNHKKLVHLDERKHKCTYCEKAFKRPKSLREHIASHTGQDLYSCPHCPQTFKVSSNMHHHRKKAHPLEWEEGRKNRLQHPKINFDQVQNQIII